MNTSLLGRITELTARYGAGAKFAVCSLLETLVPGSPLVKLCGKAFDAAQKVAENNMTADANLAQLATAKEISDLNQNINLIQQDFSDYLTKLAPLSLVPDQAEEILITAKRTDDRFNQFINRYEIDISEIKDSNRRIEELLSNLAATSKPKRELLVSSSGVGDYDTISEAIFCANSGDEIIIMPGLYNESIIIRRSVILSGFESQTGKVEITCNEDAVVVDSPNVTLNNLYIRTQKKDAYGICINPMANYTKITRCTINAPFAECLVVLDSDALVIEKCNFVDCRNGIRIDGSRAQIIGSTFFNYSNGLFVRRNGEVRVKDSKFNGESRETSNCGVMIEDDSRVATEGCEFRNSFSAILLDEHTNPIFSEQFNEYFGFEEGNLVTLYPITPRET